MAFKFLCTIISVAFLVGSAAAATIHTVGDAMGWTVPNTSSFYDTWAADKTFLPRDSLVFNWTSTHNVLEVKSKAEYDGCTKTNGIPKEISPVTINLTANGTRYFICTIGPHCQLGQKVTITVGTATSPSSPSSSPHLPFTFNAFFPLFSAILMCLLTSPAALVAHVVY